MFQDLATLAACALLVIAVLSCSTSSSGVDHTVNHSRVKSNKRASHHSANNDAHSNVSRLRIDITKYAQKFVGSGYAYGGKNPSGFDCSGFTQFVFKRFDRSLPPNSSAQSSLGRKVDLRNVKPGDLIFFGPGKSINHVALVVYNDRKKLMIVHSTSSQGVILEDLKSSTYWMNRLKTCKDVLRS